MKSKIDILLEKEHNSFVDKFIQEINYALNKHDLFLSIENNSIILYERVKGKPVKKYTTFINPQYLKIYE